MATAGVTYLLVARAAQGVTAIALAAHPPARSRSESGRACCFTWGLTSGVPMLGVVLLFVDPSNPGRAEVVVFLVVVALLVGALATLLTARAIGGRCATSGKRCAGGRGRLRRQPHGGRRRRDRTPPGGGEP